MISIKISFLLLFILFTNYCASQAPYQVVIKFKPATGNNNYLNAIHLCNGVIVHERIILTTADCMQVKVQGVMGSQFLNPAMILIYAGNPDGPINTQIARSVKSIDIAPGFNPYTLENDLAVIKLNESLPLGYRSDIHWIMIDDHEIVNQTGTASFANVPVSQTHPSLVTHPIVVENQQVCNRLGNYTILKRHDICSVYILRAGVMCNITSNDLRYVVDRGTPLIYKNKVIGLLSSVIAPSTMSGYVYNCMQLRIYNAYYTSLKSNLNWIYQKISEEGSALPTKIPIVSPPYVQPHPPQPQPQPHPQPIPFTTQLPTPSKKKNNATNLKSGSAIITLIALLLLTFNLS